MSEARTKTTAASRLPAGSSWTSSATFATAGASSAGRRCSRFFAVLSLGLGIGANTTVFTIINTLLLHPLPAGDASGVVAFYDAPANGAKPQSGEPPLSYANYRDYAGEQQCFRSVAAFTWPQVLTLNGSNGPERMFGELVTQQYFETLHVAPALGRFFLPSEASEPGSAPVAVLSYGAWQARFGGAGDVLGRTLQLNNG